MALAGRVVDPHRPQSCKVANSVAVFKELSWLTRDMAKVEQGCGAEIGSLAKTPYRLDLLDWHK